jgi:hypothetical protein
MVVLTSVRAARRDNGGQAGHRDRAAGPRASGYLSLTLWAILIGVSLLVPYSS